MHCKSPSLSSTLPLTKQWLNPFYRGTTRSMPWQRNMLTFPLLRETISPQIILSSFSTLVCGVSRKPFLDTGVCFQVSCSLPSHPHPHRQLGRCIGSCMYVSVECCRVCRWGLVHACQVEGKGGPVHQPPCNPRTCARPPRCARFRCRNINSHPPAKLYMAMGRS